MSFTFDKKIIKSQLNRLYNVDSTIGEREADRQVEHGRNANINID